MTSTLLSAIPGVAHGFFGREGGVSDGDLASLNTGEAVGDRPASVAENRARIARSLGVPAEGMAVVQQVHGARVVEASPGRVADLAGAEADAVVTFARGLAVAVKTADCVPMLVASTDGSVAVAVHAGWRGLAHGIIPAVADALFRRGFSPERLAVAIGPHIGACCFEVGAEVIAALGSGSAVQRAGRLHADLGAVAVRQWRAAGLASDAIDAVGECACCQGERYFSHRRDRGRTGRQLSAIALVYSALHLD